MKDFMMNFSWNGLLSGALMLLKAGLILLVGHYIIVFLMRLMTKSFRKIKMDLSLEKFLIKVVSITLHIIVVLSALNALGISTTGLLAALSGAVVAVALALKDSLGSIAGGIIILLTKRIQTGDFIEINGQSGTVIQVDLMHTTLRTPNHVRVIIPNGIAVNSQIIDCSQEERRRLDLVIPICYEEDFKRAEQVILKMVEALPMTLTEPEKPTARITAYNASSVDITLMAWCKTSDYLEYKYTVLETVKEQLDKSGISIPYHQLDVHLSKE